MGERIERLEGGQLQRPIREIAEAHPEVEFALVLARTIDSITSDPEQLRGAVYELARQKLAQISDDEPGEKARLMKALEVAIAGVEAHSKSAIVHRFSVPPTSGLLTPPRPAEPKASSGTAYQLSNDVFDRPTVVRDRDGDPPVLRPARPKWLSAALRYCAVLVFFAVVAGLIVAQRRGVELASLRTMIARLLPSSTPPAPKPEAVAQPVPQPPPVVDVQPKRLLPTAYGVYAESAGKLYELDLLQGRAPDPRVAISSAITKPSQTVLPDGHPRFIVFRRETVAGAADAAEVRVIARVKQATTFDPNGKPVTAPSEDAWVIRNISIPYRAAPLKEDSQMYGIEARDPDQPLPPGRYALVLKGLAYDFMVDGPIADKRQCLERLAAANGVFYSECQGR